MSPAAGLADFMYVRHLRNAVRLNMTGHTGRIGVLRQLLFFLRPPAGMQLYIAWVGGRRAGYLLLRPEGETTLITEAVDEHFRRRGVASAMIRYAQQQKADITAHVRTSNAASCALHLGAGFVQTGADQSMLIYRFRR